MVSKEALSLFRASLRTIRSSVPLPASTKLRYNVREIFDIYQDVQDPSRRTHLIQEGWHDLGVLREILKANPDIVTNLFKHFENLPEKMVKEEPKIIHEDEGRSVHAIDEVLIPHADINLQSN